MKRVLAGLLSLTLLFGCAAQGQVGKVTHAAPTPSASITAVPSIWVHDEVPVRAEYLRMWEYSATGTSDDPHVIEELVGAISELKVGAKTDLQTDDYTDIVTFTFEDGQRERLEFEHDCWVTQDDVRYKVEGMEKVRSILATLIDENDI